MRIRFGRGKRFEIRIGYLVSDWLQLGVGHHRLNLSFGTARVIFVDLIKIRVAFWRWRILK